MKITCFEHGEEAIYDGWLFMMVGECGFMILQANSSKPLNIT